jgi:hypothetical protein
MKKRRGYCATAIEATGRLSWCRKKSEACWVTASRRDHARYWTSRRSCCGGVSIEPNAPSRPLVAATARECLEVGISVTSLTADRSGRQVTENPVLQALRFETSSLLRRASGCLTKLPRSPIEEEAMMFHALRRLSSAYLLAAFGRE